MNISVLGCGRWGSFLAWYHSAKDDVTLWGREGSRSLAALRETGGNRYLKLPERVCLTSDLGAALESAQLVVISISAQELRALARWIQAYPVAGKTFILCMKGLECGTGDRLTQVFRRRGDAARLGCRMGGPRARRGFYSRRSQLYGCGFRRPDGGGFHCGNDEHRPHPPIQRRRPCGNRGWSRGEKCDRHCGGHAGRQRPFQLERFTDGAGRAGDRRGSSAPWAETSFPHTGCATWATHEATLFSSHSHNRQFGESYIKGEPYGSLAEGVPTVRALVELGGALWSGTSYL